MLSSGVARRAWLAKGTVATIHPPTRLLRGPLTVAFLCFACGLPAWGQVDVSRDLETIRVNRHMPGIAAMAIKDGHIVAQGAAGYRRQGDSTPLLVTDPFNLGSCTKWMTATLAGRLVDRGIIGWNTRVCEVFTNYPAFNTAFVNATLDQLLCHRAGVEDQNTFDAAHWTAFMPQTGTVAHLRRWVSDTVLKDAPQVPPGSYLYANQGYTVAATMLEIASGKDWETLIQEELFTPLRMKTAMLGQVFGNARPPAAPVGHDLVGGTNPVPRLKLPLNFEWHYKASLGAAGYVGCTLQDWAKFLYMHTTNCISDYMTTATGSRLQTPYIDTHGNDYGRGIVVGYRTWADGNALFHGGDVFGQDSQVFMAPMKKFIAVVGINCSSGTNPAVANALNDVATLLVVGYTNAPAVGPLLEEPAAASLDVGDQVALDYFTLPGLAYTVETATNLTGRWTPVDSTKSRAATSLRSIYTETDSAPVKFYRVRIAP